MDEIAIGAPSTDECNVAMLAHLLGIFTYFLGPLIIWLIKKNESAFVAQEAKEALNFQITLIIAHVIAVATWIFLIGMFLIPILFVTNIILCLLGAVTASKGKGYRYPVAIRLVN